MSELDALHNHDDLTISPTDSPTAPASAGISGPPSTTALIGRDGELQRLLEIYYAGLETQLPHLVTIVGEAGIGKSRLAEEFRTWIGRLPEHAAVYALRTDRRVHGQPYRTLRRLIDLLFQIDPAASQAQARVRLERGVVRLLGREHRSKAHVIGHLAGYDYSESPYVRGILDDARQIRDRAVHYAVQCLTALSDRQPLVLLLDDAHEADDASLEVIARVCRAGQGLRMMVVCLARSTLLERRPDWVHVAPATTIITLAALNAAHTRRLVASILRHAPAIPAELRRFIVHRSAGNPYFVEELIRMLIADGVIEPHGPQWQIHTQRLSALRVPDSLEELLRARLHILAADEREVLERAAVIGHTFWAGILGAVFLRDRAVGDRAPKALEEVLARLELHGLIVAQPIAQVRGESEFSFEHELLHEVTYQQIAPAQRQRYHRRIADWLIAQHQVRGEPLYSLIAEHLERAAAPLEAAQWHLQAGQYALERHATSAALTHLRRTLSLLPEDDRAERIAAHAGIAECQLADARFADALEQFQAMLLLAEQIADRAAQARAWNGIAAVYDNQVEPRQALESAERAIALAEQLADADALSTGLVRMAWATLRLDDPEHALVLGQRALHIAEQRADQAGIARSKGLIGLAYEHRGAFGPAAQVIAEALDVCRMRGDLRQVCVHLNNLGYLANARGDYAHALAVLSESLRTCDEIGNRAGEMYALSNLGSALNGLARYEEAEAASRRGIALCVTSRAAVFSDFYRELARACLGQGRIDEALEAAQQALDLARKAESGREAGMAWRVLGTVMSRLSEAQGAGSCFIESARLLDEAGAAAEHARTLAAWAGYMRRSGNQAEAEQLWDEAQTIFVRLDMRDAGLLMTPI